MVKTRRSESCSVAPDNGQRCQSQASRRAPAPRELGSSCDSVNGEQEEDSVHGEDDSWSAPEKPLLHVVHRRAARRAAPPILRSRGHKSRFGAHRRHVQIFAKSHKMRGIIDSDMDDCFPSPRRKNRRLRESMVERRAALSLRPITQKSYKDTQSMTCNSDDSTELKVTRRSRRVRYTNQSWIGDDQMHKIGYPTLNQYSDDSRDAPVRQTHKRSKNFLFNFKPDVEKPPRAQSQDKENKEDAANFAVNSRPRRVLSKPGYKETGSEGEAEAPDTTVKSSKAASDISEQEASPVKDADDAKGSDDDDDDDDEGDNDENNDNKGESSSSSDDDMPVLSRNQRGAKRKRKISSSSSERVKKSSYSLRERRAKPLPSYDELQLDMPRRTANRGIRNMPRRFSNRFPRRNVSSETDSSSDSDCRRNTKYNQAPKSPHSKNEQMRTGAGNIQPIAPETLDPKINFKIVGGLKEHVQCLKEMVLLPMMYPEVFAQFQIQPSRGVLFHGPPGTGKTLLARALANECSFGSKKVSFFMRKGADLLSKWIGESEKQLRVLFEQAAEKKPSIIFFDELDGLAPVRSGRQDQVHASIVSTLLALMDGLTNRGEIIVIGATNRIDAIDPALRRPGRFDRELFFPLPAQNEREEILKVHLNQWTSPPGEALISYLAENSVGYCGSDLKALCSEAVIQSFRRTYPQVYTAEVKLVVEPSDVKVEKVDFLRAKSVLVPASHRVTEGCGHKLNSIVQPLLEKPLKEIMQLLQTTFPHGADTKLAKVKISPNVRVAQMLITADGSEYGNSTYLAPALLHSMEHIHSYVLDLAALHRESGRTPEEACIQIFHEAKRNVPSIIYIPNIDTLWLLVSETVIGIFETQLKQIGANNPILLLATCHTLYKHLPMKLQSIFSTYRNEVYEMKYPDKVSRREFFRPLLLEAARRPPRCNRTSTKEYPVLPRAITPEPEPVSEETARQMYEKDEATRRELRIFLRDICKKLAANRLFFIFTKPVDTDEVPDYPTIIKEPMDLETMMTKVDFHRYECAKDFLNDIELICRNALEYNPARTSADKQIRHRACSLRDYAFALIKSEMDSDFEEKCQEIARRRRACKMSLNQFLPQYLNTPQDNHRLTGDQDTVEQQEQKKEGPEIVQNGFGHTPTNPRASPIRKRKSAALWSRGCVRKRKPRPKINTTNESLASNEKHSSEEEDTTKENNETIETEETKEKESSNDAFEPEGSENHDVNGQQATGSGEINCNVNDLLSPSDLLEDPLDFDDIDKALNETITEEEQVNVVINKKHLEDTLKMAIYITKKKPLSALLDLHFQLSRTVKKYIKTVNRDELPGDLLHELGRFRDAHKNTNTSQNHLADDDERSECSSLSSISDTCTQMFNHKWTTPHDVKPSLP